MKLMNVVFSSGIVANDGHEILARLNAGDDILEVVEDLNMNFGRPRMARAVRAVGENWPDLHLEAVTKLVQWALTKLDTDDRIMIKWKGDADSTETVTKFELRDHTLVIEFAHPPESLRAALAGA
jgi:hypothetical protein